MRVRRFVPLALLAVISFAVPAAARAEAPGPRTPWGVADLQGLWDRHTITPLERPTGKETKETLSDEEVAQLEAESVDRNNADKNRKVGTDADVGRAYNEFW